MRLETTSPRAISRALIFRAFVIWGIDLRRVGARFPSRLGGSVLFVGRESTSGELFAPIRSPIFRTDNSFEKGVESRERFDREIREIRLQPLENIRLIVLNGLRKSDRGNFVLYNNTMKRSLSDVKICRKRMRTNRINATLIMREHFGECRVNKSTEEKGSRTEGRGGVVRGQYFRGKFNSKTWTRVENF